MKRTITFILAILLSVGVFAQKDVIQVKENAIIPKTVKGIQPYQSKNIKLKSLKNLKKVPTGTPIGLTNYDLQTNAAVARRFLNFGDNTRSATWIQYQGTTLPAAPQRGSGYAYYDGSTWQYAEMNANKTIEGSQRAGWPAMMTNGTEEFVVSHYRSNGGLFGHYQNIGAAGDSWSSNDLTGGPSAMLWPRAASAGEYYYVIAVDDNNPRQGLHFYRSTDHGQTWSYEGILPGFTDHYASGNGDIYAIDAYDSIVAVAYFATYGDLLVWKSTDYGQTWDTIYTVNDFPVDKYSFTGGQILDMDGNGVADTVMSTDNTGDIIIDKCGKVHLVFSRMRYLDEDASDNGSLSYFPYTDYLLYWNEDMGNGKYTTMEGPNKIDLAVPAAVDTIGWSFDLNGNDTIWEFADGGDGTPFGTYYTSLTSFATLATDAVGRIYCAFTTVMEGDDYVDPNAYPNAQSYRATWVRVRDINGKWLDPVDVSSVDGTNAENVFPTIPRNVDTALNVWVQWDQEPGLNMIGDKDPATDNYIVAKSINIKDLGCDTLVVAVKPLSSDIYVVSDSCAASIDIPFCVYGHFNSDNIFSAYLSDANGDFTNEVKIGSLAGTTDGIINAEIPAGTAKGTHYRIRVKSSSPANARIDTTLEFEVLDTLAISTEDIVGSPFSVTDSTGTSVVVPYTVYGCFGGTNTFTAFLSDSTGDFTNEVPIGSVQSTISGTIDAVIPAGTHTGYHYRIRVKSSSPDSVGIANGTDLVIFLDSLGISTGEIQGSPFTVSTTIDDSLNVPYTAIGHYSSDNTFTAYLSDSTGDFTNEVEIGSIQDTASSVISAAIPVNTPSGTHYRIRVKSSSPEVVGIENATDIVIVFDSTLSIVNTEYDNKIYPNPVRNVLFVKVGNYQNFNLKITDNLGRVLIEKQTSEGYIDVSSLPAGIYNLTISNNKVYKTLKFIKQ